MDLQSIRSEYVSIRPEYLALSERLSGLIKELVDSEGIPLVQAEHRAKTVESLLGKVSNKSYTDPFGQITDLSGVRLVLYYHDDVQKVARILRQEFDVDENNSTDKQFDLGTAEFGYRSVHIVLGLSGPRASLPEWKRFAGRKTEVQIRSVLQHAWAAISHKLDYKSVEEAPRSVRRPLFRLSALLELADEQFADIRDDVDEVSSDYRESIASGSLDIPIDSESIKQLLGPDIDLPHWSELGENVGFSKSSDSVRTPHANDIAHLVNISSALGLKTLADLKSAISDAERRYRKLLEPLAKHFESEGVQFFAEAPDVLVMALLMSGGSNAYYEWPCLFRDEICLSIDSYFEQEA